MENSRFELDKFQVLSHQLSDAIRIYFAGGHATTVTNLTHSCRMLIRDITAYYKRKHSPYLDGFTLYTESIDQSHGSIFFRFKKIDGQQGIFVKRGNWVKHADNDTDELILLSDQAAYEYLSAVVQDFQDLKKMLLSKREISAYQEHVEAESQPKYIRVGIRMAKLFNDVAVRAILPRQATMRPPYAVQPRVDYLCDVFNDWDRILKHVYKRFQEQLRPGNAALGLNALNDSQRRVIVGEAKWPLVDISGETSLVYLKMKLGMATQKDYEESQEQAEVILREAMRSATRPKISSIIDGHVNKFTWHGAGYYLNIDDRVPEEDVMYIDRAGTDFIVK